MTPVIIGDATLYLGNSLEVLPTLANNSIDAVVCDPPYELTSARPGGRSPATEGKVMKGFMGMEWDGSGIANNPALWAEVLRVLKPGGHLLAFSGSRTYHRMTCAIEDAGFEVRDQIMWLYGSGFPKSMDVSKAIDKTLGVAREQLAPRSVIGHQRNIGNRRPYMDDPNHTTDSDIPATAAAAAWQGWGTALKPAHEPICVARKPLAKGLTVAANVLEHGVGALNIDASRIASTDGQLAEKYASAQNAGARANSVYGIDERDRAGSAPHDAGRWPANIIHDGSDEVAALFPAAGGGDKRGQCDGRRSGGFGDVGAANGDGKPNAAVYADIGSAARFFYCAKASRSDRHSGLDAPGVKFTHGGHMREVENMGAERGGNHHPTVKPIDLMAYLCRLVTPPGGTVLDPFMGSGSTGKACMREGFRFVGIDMTPEYVEIAKARIAHEASEVAEAARLAAIPPAQNDLFAEPAEVA